MFITQAIKEGTSAVVVCPTLEFAQDRLKYLINTSSVTAGLNPAEFEVKYEKLVATYSNGAKIKMATVDKPIQDAGALYWAFVPEADLKKWDKEFQNRG